MDDPQNAAEPQLNREKHIKYWRRCIKTLLPHQYTSNDSNRMYLGFLMVSALDLLSALDDVCTAAEKQGYIDWIYHCQHARGGFRAWPGTDFGERASEVNECWDPANVPATYLALVTLLILGDDLQRVRRAATLRWLKRLQRPDGSFGETLVAGKIEGGKDPRFGYCATGVRSILRGESHGPLACEGEVVDDIDVDGLVRCIRRAESYAGGIADVEYGESHAGYTFCSIGALHNVGRLATQQKLRTDELDTGPGNLADTLRWLSYCQTSLIEPDGTLDSEFASTAPPLASTPATTPAFPFPIETSIAGMNGRTNKVADTCYAWWSSAPLHLLGHADLYDHDALRRYLLEKTQHPILGGFGKLAGDFPDVYHSSLGLAALGLCGHGDVKAVDAGMCCSQEARARLDGIWRRWAGE